MFSMKYCYFQLRYIATSGPELDALSSLSAAQLLVMSNVLKPLFRTGQNETSDGHDEEDYDQNEVEAFREERKRYLLSRTSRYEDFYDVGDGDWGHFTLNMDHDGEAFVSLELPPTPDVFAFHVLAVDRMGGLAAPEEPAMYITTRPVDFYCEGPAKIRRGETVGLLCSLINRQTVDLEATVVLFGSEDYAFVQVGEFGHAVSYSPETADTGADVHHFTWVRAESELELRLPVAVSKQEGYVDILLECRTQVRERYMHSLIQATLKFLVDYSGEANCDCGHSSGRRPSSEAHILAAGLEEQSKRITLHGHYRGRDARHSLRGTIRRLYAMHS